MASLLEVYADMFDVTSRQVCSHIFCRRRKRAITDSRTMMHFLTEAPVTFKWRIADTRTGWEPTEHRVSRTCLTHLSEWIDHLVAVDVIDAMISGRPISETLCWHSTMFLRDVVRTEMGRDRANTSRPVPAGKMVQYKQMPLKHVRDPVSCVVCYTDEKIIEFKCGHNVCYDCLKKINRTCPYCRAGWEIGDCKRVKEMFEIIEDDS